MLEMGEQVFYELEESQHKDTRGVPYWQISLKVLGVRDYTLTVTFEDPQHRVAKRATWKIQDMGNWVEEGTPYVGLFQKDFFNATGFLCEFSNMMTVDGSGVGRAARAL